ncbi:unnamed protein product [Allacma fusca]|uniref:YjeF N-terminal domain-containing protein n=1 Tax=Allacma fusca TaxID=39272 RepID=A0A8J2LRK6_9HEXA|nr:unnamed protein product [Allacma fusca]
MSNDSDPGQKFIGCMVAVRLHPKSNGLVDHITGRVRSIGRVEHTITLDDGLLNGLAVPDLYTIKAEDIACLELITTAPPEIIDTVAPEFEEVPEPKLVPPPVNNAIPETQPQYKNFQEFTSAFKMSSLNQELEELKPSVTTAPNISIKADKGKGDQNGPEIVYTATSYESNYKAKEKSARRSAFNAYGTSSNNLNQVQGTQPQNAFTPSQNIIMAKLGLTNPVQPSNSHPSRNAKGEKTPVKNYPFNKAQNGNHLGGPGPQDRSPRGKLNQLKKDEAFEMTIDEIKAVEYNFEENLAKFDKLPAGNLQKPVAVTKIPHFKSSDTTLQANRTVDSVKLRNSEPAKVFNTDTGVVIPAIDVNVRNRILNMAHEFGLTHQVTLEVFGRAVAQICLPLLGDPYRLSPERVHDRPAVLICSGPNWQGAVGICVARILATQGVDTTVYAPKEEKGVCEKEESLYKCTGNLLSRSLKGIRNKKYDLVVLAMDDQRCDRFSIDPSQLPLQNTEIVLVDPPLVNSYTKALTTTPSRMGAGIGVSKIVIVSPVLPLAYCTNPKIKLFLVNMGIPSDIFSLNNVDYISPFGNKLIIQFFSSRHEDE